MRYGPDRQDVRSVFMLQGQWNVHPCQIRLADIPLEGLRKAMWTVMLSVMYKVHT